MFEHFIFIGYDLSLLWLHYETLFISNCYYIYFYEYLVTNLDLIWYEIIILK